MKPDLEPTKGASGDPYKPPVRLGELIKQRPIE